MIHKSPRKATIRRLPGGACRRGAAFNTSDAPCALRPSERGAEGVRPREALGHDAAGLRAHAPQSFRSDQLSVKVRPAESSQVVGALLEFVTEHQTKQSALALARKAAGAPDHDLKPVGEFRLQIEFRVLLGDIGIEC
jgi:hypothetical protein